MPSDDWQGSGAGVTFTRCLLPVAAMFALGVGAPAAAQVWTREAKIDLGAVATTNGAGRPSGLETSDLILSATPSVRFGRSAADYSLSLNGSLEVVGSTQGTRENRVLPRAEAELKSTVVDRLIFFDALGVVRQTEVDPYLGRGSSGVPDSLRRAEFVQLSPYLRYEFSSRVSLNARLDETYSSYGSDSSANFKVHAARVQLEGRPEPIGFGLEVSRQDTRYVELADSSWTLDSARASLQFAALDQLILGVIAGRERTSSVLADRNENLAGLSMKWGPSPRTNLDARLERRFFGNGFNVNLAYRAPSWAMSVAIAREPVTSSASLGTVSSGQSLSEFLDAILASRYPDPIQRAALVEGLIASRGLPTELARALELLADYAQLRTSGNVTIAYLSPRTVLSLSVFAQSLRLLSQSDSTPIVAATLTADASQGGMEFDASYVLTRESRLGLRARWLEIRGLGARYGERTRDRDIRALWSVNLSPRSEFSFGPQWRRVTTTSLNTVSFTDLSVQGVLSHRF